MHRVPHIAFVAAWLLILSSLAVNASPNPHSPFYWTNSGNGNGHNGWAHDVLSRGVTPPTVETGSVPFGGRRTGRPTSTAPAGIVTTREPAPPNACGPGRFEIVNRAAGEALCVGNPAE